MEPKVTCLDSATWLRNFNPEDIAIGVVIRLTPTPECDLGVASCVQPRVMDITEAHRTYYYWPKGDANADADGCWIPDTNVSRYVIELLKDTHPGNNNLRNSWWTLIGRRGTRHLQITRMRRKPTPNNTSNTAGTARTPAPWIRRALLNWTGCTTSTWVSSTYIRPPTRLGMIVYQ